jgi:hypothetical protein
MVITEFVFLNKGDDIRMRIKLILIPMSIRRTLNLRGQLVSLCASFISQQGIVLTLIYYFYPKMDMHRFIA